MTRGRRCDLPDVTPGQLEAICKALADTMTGLTGTERRSARSWDSVALRISIGEARNGSACTMLSGNERQRTATRTASSISLVTRWTQHGTVETAQHLSIVVLSSTYPLAFVGLEFGEDGKFHRTVQARTLSEAEQRAQRLRSTLEGRNVHPDVLRSCRAELVAGNYFHAVLEATKSLAGKLRERAGVSGDGAELVDRVLLGNNPILAINSLRGASEWSEQRGVGSLVKGIFGTFRNPTAHQPRTEWQMTEEDALDLLVIASYAHRRIDRANKRA